jgi:hypothetical protein
VRAYTGARVHPTLTYVSLACDGAIGHDVLDEELEVRNVVEGCALYGCVDPGQILPPLRTIHLPNLKFMGSRKA